MMAFEGGIDDTDAVWDKVWAETLQVNVQGAGRLMRAAVRHFRRAGGGIIVTISSWVAQRGSTNPVTIAYAASQGGVRGGDPDDRARLRQGRRAQPTSSPPASCARACPRSSPPPQGGEDRRDGEPRHGRMGAAGEIAALVAFLRTGTCRHLSGATLDVNGATYVR